MRYDKIIWNFIVFLQSYDLNLTVLVIKSTGFYNWNVTNNEVLSKMKSNPKLNVIKTKMLSKLACHQDWNVLNMIGFVLIKTEFFSNVTAFVLKLDGVGPVDNRPSTKNLHNSVKKKMWHVTHDTWHVTCDMWHMIGEGRWAFFQNISSLALTVWEGRCLKVLKEKDQSVNQLMN